MHRWVLISRVAGIRKYLHRRRKLLDALTRWSLVAIRRNCVLVDVALARCFGILLFFWRVKNLYFAAWVLLALALFEVVTLKVTDSFSEWVLSGGCACSWVRRLHTRAARWSLLDLEFVAADVWELMGRAWILLQGNARILPLWVLIVLFFVGLEEFAWSAVYQIDIHLK